VAQRHGGGCCLRRERRHPAPVRPRLRRHRVRETPSEAIRGAVGIAQAVERAATAGTGSASTTTCAAWPAAPPSCCRARRAQTERIRVGAAGIMLPNHARSRSPSCSGPWWRCTRPDRPGARPRARHRPAHRARPAPRLRVDPGAEFPQQVAELLAFLGDGFPEGHPYAPLVAAPSSTSGPSCSCSAPAATAAVRRGQRAERGLRAPHEPRPRRRGCAATAATSRRPGRATPYSAMSVLAFASDDEQAQPSSRRRGR
jgi:hypothetical protein